MATTAKINNDCIFSKNKIVLRKYGSKPFKQMHIYSVFVKKGFDCFLKE
ncbi:hypothetical protein HVS_00255 [Acetivibrio saccincola]|uniref:Uncharacterized protein n=1 Tax=Acetivibrio saccincola TaxID=1677857 RepID=A0A2K9EKU1_9FIRM|nr:hypothetical protein HVS_00255 [Acetivibrio saccincola]